MRDSPCETGGAVFGCEIPAQRPDGRKRGESGRMYENRTEEEVCRELGADSRRGLDGEEVKERLIHYGENVLRGPRRQTIGQRLAAQLCDSLIFVLFAAAAISLMLGEYADAAIILAVVAMNAAVGIVQEGKAQKALESLKKLTRLEAFVIRDGREQKIDARGLVPGDLVLLEAGCQVPADLRLIETVELKAEEAALTGESEPVRKNSRFLGREALPLGERKNMAFMTSYVTAGRGRGIVTATGMNTEIGRIAAMIGEAPEEETPLQRRLGELGKILSLAAVGLCALLFLLAIAQRRDVMEMLITAISLAVAAVPEGLPAVVTIVLALSVTRMVRAGTIVRRLPSVETLGSVTVVCSDKTGTLTRNEMTVTDCLAGGALFSGREMNALRDTEDGRRLVEAFALCNNATQAGGEATEAALLRFAQACGEDAEALRRRKARTGELPFDSSRKMMTVFCREGRRDLAYTKGAPDVVLARCSRVLEHGEEVLLDPARRERIAEAVREFSGRGLRVLAAAMARDGKKTPEKEMTFLGLAGMMDPPRKEAGQAVEAFRRASVRTIMITGDYAGTALAVARKLGIAKEESQCLSGAQLDQMDDAELKRRLPGISVFARVSPEHKVRIVRALKASGHITAMTGDGVNDAPSLKIADIGIAMGKSGTDVARQAADLILTDDNFATIEKAIEEGRGIYENIRKSVIFLLSSNLGEILTMFAAVAAGFPSPLKAAHILWVNLITDSLPALALGVDSNDGERLMRRPPRKPRETLFAGGGWFCTLFYGALIAAVSLTAFLWAPWQEAAVRGLEPGGAAFLALLREEEVLRRAQTYAFTVLGISELFHAVGMRSPGTSVFAAGLFSNRLMAGAFFGGLALQAAVTCIPAVCAVFKTALLGPGEWGVLLVLSAAPLLAHEILAALRGLNRRR